MSTPQALVKEPPGGVRKARREKTGEAERKGGEGRRRTCNSSSRGLHEGQKKVVTQQKESRE
jgi:hypothetical protein